MAQAALDYEKLTSSDVLKQLNADFQRQALLTPKPSSAPNIARGLTFLDDVPVMLIAFDNAKVSERPSKPIGTWKR